MVFKNLKQYFKTYAINYNTLELKQMVMNISKISERIRTL